jgi:membrane-associated phospholipid phosphatase
VRDLPGRARPYVYDCLQQGRTEAECVDNPEAVRSFPGGHFLMATAASVLTCTQHLYVHLYGRGWDGMTCAMTLASDAAVGVMRIVADSHWATDQIAGAALGALVGWGVPFVMHYAMHSPPGREGTQPAALVVPTPIAFPSGGGLGVFGLF